MTRLAGKLMTTACLSLALAGPAALAVTLATPGIAVAKDHKDKGKPDKPRGRARAEAKKAAKQTRVKADSAGGGCKSGSYSGGGVAGEIGVHPCQLGNLNAWNGKSGNADPNSMPGRLDGFEQIVAENLALEAAVNDALLAVAVAPLPADTAGYGQTDACSADRYCTYDLSTVVDDPLNPDDDGDYDLLAAYNGYVDALIAAEGDYADNAVDERATLAGIANKDIDDATFDAIRAWIAARLDG